MIKYYISTLFAIFSSQVLISQIKGVIFDAETDRPVPGATIIYQDNGAGIVSDADGRFESEFHGKIVISAIGYIPKNTVLNPGRDHYVFLLEPEYYQLQEVVVEAFNRSRRLVDVPGSLSLIQSRQIERENPVTIVPLLNQAPGVFAHSGALNTSRITVRGIGARVPYSTGKVRAYLNNIPLTSGSGISIVEDIDPSVIERIEIIKGPATSVYGAGLGGTIILTAKNPTMKPSGIKNDFQAGSWDMYRNTISVNTGNDDLGLGLQYSHIQSDGYRQNNQYRRDGLTALSSAKLSDNAGMTFLLSYTSLKAHIPSSLDSITFATSPRSAALNWLQTRGYEDYDKLLAGLSAIYDINQSLSAGLSVFSTMYDEMEMRPFDVLKEDRHSGGTRFKLTYRGTLPAGSFQVLGGAELFAENFKYRSYENIGGVGEQGNIISDNKEHISYYNIFAQGDLDLHRLKLSAGLNINSSRTDYKDLFNSGDLNASGLYNYDRIFSPRVSANYRYYLNNSVFMTISHGFSPPSLSETLTPEGFINPGIKPETSWSLEGGLRGNLFVHRLFYDINIYSMRVSDLLVAERVGEDAWVGKNAGESLHSGLEMEMQFVIIKRDDNGPGGWWQPEELTVSPNFTYNSFRFTDFNDEGVDFSGNRLPGIPDLVFNIGIYGALNGGLYVFADIRAVGQMPLDDENSLYTDKYMLANIATGYRKSISGNLLADVWFSAGNIFNSQYASMILVNAPGFSNRPPRYYYPGNPRNFSAGLKLSYRFN